MYDQNVQLKYFHGHVKKVAQCIHNLSRIMTKPIKRLCAQWRFRSAWTSAQSDIQISLGIRPVCLVSSLSAWRNVGSLATQWAHNEDSDQTGWIPRLIWVVAGRTHILLVLSCRGSFAWVSYLNMLLRWSTRIYLCPVIISVWLLASKL